MMGCTIKKNLIAMVMAVSIAGFSTVVYAIDAPKWVAALYVDAQKVVGLRWNIVPGATAYKILRSTVQGKDYQEITQTSVPQFLDKDISPGVTYYYVLQSVAGADVSANSSEKNVAIPGEKKVQALTSPQWDKISSQQSEEYGKVHFKVALFWGKGPSNVIAYNVFRGETSGGPYDLISSTQEPRYVDATVEAGKTYYYTLKAMDNSFAESDYSEERSVFLEVAEKKKKEKVEKLKLIAKKAREIYEIRQVDPDGQIKMLYPAGVDIYDGKLYVVIGGVKLVAIFNFEDGKFISTFGQGEEPEGRLKSPNGLCIDKNDGTVYIADMNRIMKFTDRGDFIEYYEYPPFQFTDKGRDIIKATGFVGVRLAPNGEIWAVDNNNSRVLRADGGGKVIAWLGEFGKTEKWGYGFAKPGGISFSKDRAFVTDMMNARVIILDLEGQLVAEVGSLGDAVGSFGSPRGNIIDKKGRLLVIDQKSSTIQGFDNDGKYLFVVSSEDPKKPLELALPHEIAISEDGRLAVSEVLVDSTGGGVKVIELIEE